MTITVPEWADLTPYDQMELIAFHSKAESEGFDYTFTDYRPKFETPKLQAVAADRPAMYTLWHTTMDAVGAWWETHDADGVELHNTHIHESRDRHDGNRMWGARTRSGVVVSCDSEEEARYLVADPGWGCLELLHRSEPGGEWVAAPTGGAS